jgi:signal transduction histidine kinase
MKNDNHDITLGIDQAAYVIQPKSWEKNASEYNSALVHEIRNPLNNIMLSVESLIDRIGSDVDDKMFLDVIWRGAKRINNLLESMLNQRMITQQNQFSIHRLLDDVLEMVGDRIILKDIAVHINYEKQDFKAIMNEQEMKIALTNIIINAIEAMATHNGQLNIVIKSVTAKDKFIVQIKDNGCGISKKNLKNVFASHLTTKRVGLGYGLAAAYDILHSNHVEVFVKSTEGIGTCFTLLFENA